MSKKKKIGSAGRYGSRYGKKVKKIVSEIERVQKKRHVCPKCKMRYVKRIAKGIYYCKKCKTKFADLAYYPSESV